MPKPDIWKMGKAQARSARRIYYPTQHYYKSLNEAGEFGLCQNISIVFKFLFPHSSPHNDIPLFTELILVHNAHCM